MVTLAAFDTGSTGFMLVATSLVMLMTPGLAFFYGGLVGRKHTLTIMTQSFVSLGWTTVIWFVCGYLTMLLRHDEGRHRRRTDLIGNLQTGLPAAASTSTRRSRAAIISMYVFVARTR